MSTALFIIINYLLVFQISPWRCIQKHADFVIPLLRTQSRLIVFLVWIPRKTGSSHRWSEISTYTVIPQSGFPIWVTQGRSCNNTNLRLTNLLRRYSCHSAPVQNGNISMRDDNIHHVSCWTSFPAGITDCIYATNHHLQWQPSCVRPLLDTQSSVSV